MQWRWCCHENKIFLLIVCLCTFSDLEERRDSGTGSALINICARHCDRHGGKRQVHTGVGRQPHKLITSIKCNTCYESICEESDRSFSLCPQAPSAPAHCIKSPCIKSPWPTEPVTTNYNCIHCICKRVLKEKTVYRRPGFLPYVGVQCDFWRALESGIVYTQFTLDINPSEPRAILCPCVSGWPRA